jgi:hypothetical protein
MLALHQRGALGEQPEPLAPQSSALSLNPGKRKGDFPETVPPKKSAPPLAELPTARGPPLPRALSSQHPAALPCQATLEPTPASSAHAYRLPRGPEGAPLPPLPPACNNGAGVASVLPLQSQHSGSVSGIALAARGSTSAAPALARSDSGTTSVSGSRHAGSASGLGGVGRGDDGDGDVSDDSLGSIWRLPGLGGEWGVEESDIRIPPLPPGRLFQDEFDVSYPDILRGSPANGLHAVLVVLSQSGIM